MLVACCIPVGPSVVARPVCCVSTMHSGGALFPTLLLSGRFSPSIDTGTDWANLFADGRQCAQRGPPVTVVSRP